MHASPGDTEPRTDGASAARRRLDAAPGLARIAAGAWLRTAGWTAGIAVRAGRRTVNAAISGENPLDLLRDAQIELIDGAQRLLGVSELEERIAGLLGSSRTDDRDESLKDRGHALLNRSSELDEHGDAHPAYARILSEISPDEARILRLLATDGAQPAIDIRTWRPLGIGSSVVAPGLTMIAQHAGCRHPDRVPAYLSNLYRLGLIWFSRDTLPEPGPYQVLEAQPDVVAAIRETGRGRIIRRSIHLTPFGGHFCEFCLPLDTAEIETLGQTIDAGAGGDG
jgi:Abortive infection alpha